MNNSKTNIENRIGIWIDHKHAYLFKISADGSEMEDQKSEIHIPDEENLIRFDRDPFSQSEKQHHELSEELKYFKKIIEILKNEDYVYLFGPGNAKIELNNIIDKEGKHFPCKVLAIETADKLTQNQMLQKVNKYFESLDFEDAKRRLMLEKE